MPTNHEMRRLLERVMPFSQCHRARQHQDGESDEVSQIRPLLGCKALETAPRTLVEVELRHMLRRGQMEDRVGQDLIETKKSYTQTSYKVDSPPIGCTFILEVTH